MLSLRNVHECFRDGLRTQWGSLRLPPSAIGTFTTDLIAFFEGLKVKYPSYTHVFEHLMSCMTFRHVYVGHSTQLPDVGQLSAVLHDVNTMFSKHDHLAMNNLTGPAICDLIKTVLTPMIPYRLFGRLVADDFDKDFVTTVLKSAEELEPLMFSPDGPTIKRWIATLFGVKNSPDLLKEADDVSIVAMIVDMLNGDKVADVNDAIKNIVNGVPDRSIDIVKCISEQALSDHFHVFLNAVNNFAPNALSFIDVPKMVADIKERDEFGDDEDLCEDCLNKHHTGLRLYMIATMAALCQLGGGKQSEDGGDKKRSKAGPLRRALGLRRFCRVRGEDAENMEMELVEPFARDIVRFL
jgi:hypothetical protein